VIPQKNVIPQNRHSNTTSLTSTTHNLQM